MNASQPRSDESELLDVRCPTCKHLLLKVSRESRMFTFEIRCRHCGRIFRAEIAEKQSMRLIRESGQTS